MNWLYYFDGSDGENPSASDDMVDSIIALMERLKTDVPGAIIAMGAPEPRCSGQYAHVRIAWLAASGRFPEGVLPDGTLAAHVSTWHYDPEEDRAVQGGTEYDLTPQQASTFVRTGSIPAKA